MTTLGWLIERDNRKLFSEERLEWAEDDPEYKVTPLVAGLVEEEVLAESVQAKLPPSLPNTDDTQERIQLMNDLFALQEQEISQLKQSLEAFVEVVEGVLEITEVVSHSAIENRSKLILIGDSCKRILKSSD